MKESKRAIAADADVAVRTHIGGQALMEGIMMRGRYNWAVAVREPGGGIYTEEHDLASGRKKNSWLLWPVVRGCTAFVESLVLGCKALSISADHAYDWSEDEGKGEGDATAAPGEGDVQPADAAQLEGAALSAAREAAEESVEESARADAAAPDDAPDAAPDDGQKAEGMGAMMGVSMVVGLVVGVVLFIVVPAWLSNLVFGEQAMNTTHWNIFDGLVRVAIFIAYIALIGQMSDIKRMFAYHGAEHKTIHAFEHGEELTCANCQKYPRLHVRCGTAFMIMVMVIAILVYTALGEPMNALVDLTGVEAGPLRFVLVVLVRIVLMPLIAGFSYEVSVRWAGRHPQNPLVKVVLWPGMQMQRLTTNPPDDSMLECAIVAMNIVVAREEAEAAAVEARTVAGEEKILDVEAAAAADDGEDASGGNISDNETPTSGEGASGTDAPASTIEEA